MYAVLNDFRYAYRCLLKSPGFTILAVLTLAIGIGANVTVFSVINSVLIRPLRLPQPDRLIRLYSDWEPAWPLTDVSPPDFLDWRERNTTFLELAGWRTRSMTLQQRSGAERISAAAVSANYFHVIGVGPTIGRGFTAKEKESGDSNVAILSEGLCRRLFGSTEGVLGRSVELNAESYTIVGIMPAGFHLPDETVELWVPLHFNESQLRHRDNRWLEVYGRLKANVTIGQAQQQLSNIAANLAREYPDDNSGFGIRLVPVQEDIVGKQRPALLLLQGAP
jgi:putative ABC transport system permease protein